VACQPSGSKTTNNFNNTGPGTQVASVGGGSNNVKSPCAGGSVSASGSSRGDGDQGSQGGGTTASGQTNSQDCSKVETPPLVLEQTVQGAPSPTAPSVTEILAEARR
jgi:hypothetical protein